MVLLRKAGITRIYGAPGTTELSLVQSASRYDVKYYFTLHDTIAVGMADGYTRCSGRISAVNLHASQGFLNAAGFIRVASRDNVPLLVICGSPATTYDIYEPNHFVHNLQQFTTPIAKWGWILSNVKTLAQVFKRAICTALAPPQGPAVVFLPQDLLEKDYDLCEVPSLDVSFNLNLGSIPAPSAIERAARALLRARRVTVFAGLGSQRETDWVEAVADVIGAPVIAEALDRGPQVQNVYCRSDFPLFLGFFDIRDRSIRDFVSGSDVLFFVGGRTAYPKVIGDLPQTSTIIQADVDPAQVGRRHRVDVALVGDVGLSLQHLRDRLEAEIEKRHLAGVVRQRKRFVETRIERLRAARNRRLARPVRRGRAIVGMQLVKALNKCLPPEAIIVDDSQCMGFYLKTYHHFPVSRTLYGSLASHLGWALPASLGIKQADESRLVVCLVGDGSFMFSLQALATAATHKIPVLVVVANNRGFASLKKEIAAKSRLAKEVVRILSLDDPEFDIASVSRGLGLAGTKARTVASLEEAIESGLRIVTKEGRACVVDVVMSSSWRDWDEAWHVSLG
jgi:benzoylformate decarboxylase